MSKPTAAPTFLAKLHELTTIADNKDFLTGLREQAISARGVTLFVGAGLSAQFRYKTWQQFLLDQARLMKIEEEIQERILRGEYENAASDLLKARRDQGFYHAVHVEYGDAAGKQVSGGAVSFLPALAKGTVVTTNFDHVLERAFEQAGRRFERIVLGAREGLVKHALTQNTHTLIKIHGDADDDSDLVFTTEAYDREYENAGTLPKGIERILNNRPCLFLGCSLNRDRIMTILGKVACAHTGHYAILEFSKEDNLAKKLEYFADLRINPIFYPKGEHRFVEMILKALSEAVPSSEPLTAWNKLEKQLLPVLEEEKARRLPVERILKVSFGSLGSLGIAVGTVLGVLSHLNDAGLSASIVLVVFGLILFSVFIFFYWYDETCRRGLVSLKTATNMRDASLAREAAVDLVCLKHLKGYVNVVLRTVD